MKTLSKGVLWMTGCLVLTFAISIGLSRYFYGYFDRGTLVIMGAMLLPVLGAAAFILLWTEGRRGTPPRPSIQRREREKVGTGKEA